MTPEKKKDCYWIQFYDIPAIEVEVCAINEKEAKRLAHRAWRRDSENRPKIMSIIKKTGRHG